MCGLGESSVPHCVFLNSCLFFYLCKHYRNVWAQKGQEVLTWQWGREALWAGPGVMSSFRVICTKNHPQGEQLSMTLESSLAEDFDARLGADGYSGPTLAVGDDTLECSLTEQWVGVQIVTVITIILCRETGGEISAKCRVSVLESRLSFCMNSHISHLSGS